jgi:transposase-like protein
MQRRRFSREFKVEAVKLVRERGVAAGNQERAFITVVRKVA